MLHPPFSNRRQFLANAGVGAGALSLGSLLASDSVATNGLHHRATAKSVIFLFMSGAPSQVDTFDPKPGLATLAGKDVPDSLAKRVPRIKRAGLKNLMASPWEFKQYGESGLPVSSLFPEVAKQVDDLCFIRSMTHRNPVHGPGECVALTGTATGNRPSLGAWSLFGLGSMNQQLPAFIAMNLHTDGMQHAQAAGWGTGFLPSKFQGTVVDPKQGFRHVARPEGTSPQRRSDELEMIRRFNESFRNSIEGNSELDARIASYKIADDLQKSGPELFDLASETKATQTMYGMDADATREVALGCLTARRMVERGVRFVQVRVGGWDAHSNIKGNHEKLASRTDKPIAALLADLKQRDLLKSTLVVWGGEFGRTPTMEGLGNGRDHSPAAYTVWLSGGGAKGGQAIGSTDAIGYTVVDRPTSPQDLHATILHALGVNAKKLTFDHHGLIETPLGVTGGEHVVEVFG